MEKIKLVLASRNPNKVRELRVFLAPFAEQVDVLSLDDIGFSGDIEETGETFEENALLKAKVPASLGYVGIADDSGLSVDALDGAPGVYSARYAGEHGDDDANNDLLLDHMKEVPDEKRTASFVSVIACVFPDGSNPILVRGTCEGRILWERQGTGGFGYDPLFYYEPYGKTYAQMNPEEKNAISHRARAMEQFARAFGRRLADREAKKAAPALNSRQRANLRSIAAAQDTIFQIGKNGIGEETVRQISNALEARELIKIRVLENAPVLPREAAQALSELTGAEVVTVIGTRFVLYRPASDPAKRKIRP